MMVTIRMQEEEKNLVTAYAKLEGRFLSEAMKRAFLKKQKMNMIWFWLLMLTENIRKIKQHTLQKKLERNLDFEEVSC